jgi:4-carboxymuconolactone decarboxylase
MSRLPPLDPAALTSEQKRVYDHIAAGHSHGQVRGPWPIELRIPEVAQAYHALYERLCCKPKVGKRLFELMVIVVARHMDAQFEWFAHERQALEHGVPPAAVDAIRERRPPVFERDDERLVYELITELNQTHRLAQATYDRALAAFGEENLVELVTGAGTYTSIAMQLNAFEIAVPADARPLPV